MKRTTLLVLGLLLFYAQLSAQSMLKAVIDFDSPSRGCAPLTVKFRDRSSGPAQVTKWEWDFGDGTTSTEQHPTHVYTQPGTYNASLTVIDATGKRERVFQGQYATPSSIISVGPKMRLPNVAFICGVSPIYIKSLEPADPDASYEWSDGSTLESMRITQPGTYSLKYTVCGQTLYDTTTVVQISGGPRLYQDGEGYWKQDSFAVRCFSNVPYSSYYIKSRECYWGDNTMTRSYDIFSISHKYAKPGTYQVGYYTTTYGAVGCTDTSDMITLTVRQPYVKHNSWRDSIAGLMSGSSFVLDAGNAGATYKWTRTGDPSFSFTGQKLTVSNPDEYYVTITKDKDEITDHITVKTASAPFKLTYKVETTGCNSIVLSASTIPAGMRTYDVDWGDGNVVNNTSLGIHYYKENGTYRLRLWCRDRSGDVGSVVDSAYIDLTIPQKPVVNLGDDIVLAAGDSVILSNKLHQQPYLYRWSTGSKDIAIKVKQPGTYGVSTMFCGTTVTDTVVVSRKQKEGLNCDFTYTQTPTGSVKGLMCKAVVTEVEGDPVFDYYWMTGVNPPQNGLDMKEPYLEFPEDGNYVITLVVTTASGKVASVTKNVYVSGAVWSLPLATVPAGICNDSALVTASPFADEPFYVRWSNGTTGLTTMLPRPGRYTATLYDTTNRVRATHTFDLQRSRAFFTSIQLHTSSSADSLFAYPDEPTHTVSWFRNDTLISTGRYIEAPVSGIYRTRTITTAGCMDSTLPYTYVAKAERMTPAFTAIADKCKPQVISFDSKATQLVVVADTIATVEWSFGDRAVEKGKAIRHEYYKAGSYTVKMKMTSVSGYTDSVSKQITVLSEQDWSSKVVDDSTSIPGTHILKVTTAAKNVSFKWSNGSTNDTTHVKVFGKYFVTLSDSCGNVRNTDSLKVPEPRWNLTITATKIGPCFDAMQLVAHTDYYKGPYKIVWFDRKAADSIKVTEPGAYTARLEGDSSKTYALAVFYVDSSMLFKPAIRIKATAQSDTLIAFPLQNDNNSYSYTWYNSDSVRFPPINAPRLIDPTPGYYYVKMTSTTGCTRYSPTVYYQPHDSASIDVRITTQPCNSQSLLAYPVYKGFGNSTDTVISLSYDWGFDIKGTTTNTRAPRDWWYSYPGTYNFRLTGTTRTGRTFSVVKEYTVEESNSPDVDILHDSVSVPGMHMLVAVTRPGKYPVQWTDFSTNDTIITNNPGRYTVVVYNPCGGGLTGIDGVDIYGAPWSLNAGIKRIYCGDSAVLAANATALESDSVLTWSTGERTDMITVKRSGRYIVTLGDTRGKIRVRDTVEVLLEKPFQSAITLQSGVDRDTLVATPYNNAYTYTWYRNDSLNFNNSSIYPKPINGNYRVEVKNNEGCSDLSEVFTYTGKNIPLTIDFNSRASDCNEQRFTFTAAPLTGDAIVKYQWNFGDNNTDTAAIPEHTFAEGTYNVSLTVTTASGKNASTNKQLVVPAMSKWTVDIVSAANACGDTVTLKVNTADKARYFEWNTPSEDSMLVVTAPGKYSVSVFDSCHNLRGTDTINVTISEPLKATVNLHTGASIDTLIASPYNAGYTYTWYKNDSLLTTGQSSLYNPSISGDYRVEVRSNTGCVSLSDVITYVAKPGAVTIDFSYKASDCNEQQFIFTAVPLTGDAIVNYQWNFGDNNTDTAVIPEHTFAQGIYNVSLTVTTALGKTGTISKQLTIPAMSIWIVDIASAANACGDTVTLKVNTADKARYFEWNTSSKDRELIVTASGKYSVSVFDSCHNLRGTDTINVAISEPLKATVNLHTGASIDTLIASPYNAGYTYTWYKNDSLLTTGQSSSYNPSISGDYRVEVRSNTGCVSLSDAIRYVAKPVPLTIDFNYKASDCNEQRFTFTTAQIADDAIIKYEWNFGDNSTDTAAVPAHTFAEGVYNVSLRVTTTSGRNASINKQLNVPAIGKWTVNIVSVANACGDTVTLKVNTADKARYFKWNTSSEERQIIVTTAGSYSVNVYDSCNIFRGTAAINVSIAAPLKATISLHAGTSTDTLIASPYHVDYTYAWYRNDSLLSNSNSSAYFPSISGKYRVKVMNSGGCNDLSAILTYEVKQAPLNISFSYKANDCNEQQFTFSVAQVAGDPIVKYEWNFGDNTTANTAVPVHSFTAGTYNVSLTVTTASGRKATVSQQMVVPAQQQWTVDINAAANACVDVITLDVDTDQKARYFKWSNGANSREITVTASGTYSVSVFDSCNILRGTDTITVTVEERLRVAISVLRGTQDTLVAASLTGGFTFPVESSVPGYNFQWYLNGVFYAEGPTFLLNPVAGTYTLQVDKAPGCLASFALYYEPVVLPDPQVEVGNIRPGDSTLTVKGDFNNNFNADNKFTVQLMLLNPGGRETGMQPNEVIDLGTTPGTDRNTTMKVHIPDTLACGSNYVIRMIASSPADTTVWSKPLTIMNQPPMPVITQRGDSLFTTGKYNWQWYKDGAPIAGATSATYRARANGAYTVESRNGSTCVTRSAPVSVVITAVGEVTLGTNTAKLFPNPSEGPVSLKFEKPLLKAVIINVYDLNGRKVYTGTTTQQLQRLDLGHLPQGYYLVELIGYGTKKVLPLILQ